jgi:thiol-disulfide isomerase/thioredoxin
MRGSVSPVKTIGEEQQMNGARHHERIRALCLGLLLPAFLALPGGPWANAALAAGQGGAGAAKPTLSAPLTGGWEEAAGLQAVTADTIDTSARIFDSPDFQQQLLVPGKGDQAFLLALKTQTFEVVPRLSLVWTTDYLPVVDPKSALPGGSFTSQDGIISFEAEAGNWKIQPEPPLVGLITPAKLHSAKPDYVHAAARYKPEPTAIQALKGVTEDTQVVVFFGTWCTICKHYLPHFLKTLELAGNPKFTVEYFGMSEDQREPADAIARYHVSKTPTIIFLRGGQELGRIEEEPDVSVEADMVRILKAK